MGSSISICSFPGSASPEPQLASHPTPYQMYQEVEVLRSDRSWSLGIVHAIENDEMTIAVADGEKKIPKELWGTLIRTRQGGFFPGPPSPAPAFGQAGPMMYDGVRWQPYKPDPRSVLVIGPGVDACAAASQALKADDWN